MVVGLEGEGEVKVEEVIGLEREGELVVTFFFLGSGVTLVGVGEMERSLFLPRPLGGE